MLTRRMQLAAIARLVYDGEELGDSDLADFSPELRQAYYVAMRWLSHSPDTALATAANALGVNPSDLIEEIQTADNLRYPALDEIAGRLPPVSWLWEGWIPRGMISLLGAVQGTGKSYFALDLARITIAGDDWPDGAGPAERGRVVYVEGEGVPQITNTRAELLGIDKTALFPMIGDGLAGAIDFGRQSWRDELADMVHVVRPELVIVDSFSSVNGRGQNAVEDVNGILVFFAGLASAYNCGVLIIHHLRKPPAAAGAGGQSAEINIHDFRGSGHITAMARTVLGLSVAAPGYSLEGPRRLRVVKSNLADYPPALAVGIEDLPDGRKRFTYSASDAESAKRDNCGAWLVQLLEIEGPSKPADIVKAGIAEGYSRPTIYRARKALGDLIGNTDGRQSPANLWYLVEESQSQLSHDFGLVP